MAYGYSPQGTAVPYSNLQFKLESATDLFVFEDFEIPSHLDSLGSDEVTTLHQFPGGRRVIQAFGKVPRESITWSGILIGADSMDRFKQLNALVGPNSTTLTYGPFKFVGLFKSCKGTPGFEGYIPYHATFVPTIDLTDQALSPIAPYDQYDAVYTSSLDCNQSANAAAASSDTFSVQQMAVSLNAAVSDIDAANYAASISAFEVCAATQYAFLQTATNMDDAALVIPMYVNTSLVIIALGTITSPQVTFLTVDNPNLFRLAARYYGDSTQWGLIAAANGDMAPFNFGVYNLVIPLNPVLTSA
jgi:hypothetical protein